MESHVAPWTGEQEFAQIVEAIEKRGGQRAPPIPLEPVALLPTQTLTSTVGETQEDRRGQGLRSEQSELPMPSMSTTASVLGLDVTPPTSQAIAV